VAADVVDASALTGSLNLQAPSLSAAIVGGAAAFNAGVQITGGSGDDTLWGSAGADVINGGAGNDRIVLSAAGVANQADILMGGAGVDQFRFQGSTQANLLTQSSGTAQVVKIADFSAGTDKIALIGGGFNAAALGTVQTVGSAATLTDVWNAINPIAASTATNASMVVVSVLAGTAAGTYLYVNDGVAGVSSAADMLIDMTGLAGTLSTQDFVFT
jgi:Ca2+-binding RTX toxin-like protein